MKARRVQPGDFVKEPIKGRKVAVDHVDHRARRVGMFWSRRTSTGVTGVPPETDVKLIYRPKGKW